MLQQIVKREKKRRVLGSRLSFTHMEMMMCYSVTADKLIFKEHKKENLKSGYNFEIGN